MSKVPKPFLVHSCQFPNCKCKFSSIPDLVKHVEYTHLDWSPRYLEELEESKPPMVPLSYVLRLFPPDENAQNKDKSKFAALRTLTGVKENRLLAKGASLFGNIIIPDGKHVETKNKGIYKCHCGKSYKTANGLKNHTLTHNAILTVTNTLPKDSDGATVNNSTKTTLALLIQANNVKDTEVLAKLANGTNTAIVPLPGGKSFFPLEISTGPPDSNSKIIFQSTFPAPPSLLSTVCAPSETTPHYVTLPGSSKVEDSICAPATKIPKSSENKCVSTSDLPIA